MVNKYQRQNIINLNNKYKSIINNSIKKIKLTKIFNR